MNKVEVDGAYLCFLYHIQHSYGIKFNQLVYHNLYGICQRAKNKAA